MSIDPTARGVGVRRLITLNSGSWHRQSDDGTFYNNIMRAVATRYSP